MENVLFSVIIPVYNTQKYLAECLNSVLNQSYQNFELLLINDGSTDGSGILCDDFASKDPRITVIHQKNQGQLFTRRVGIENAKGDYLVFLDSDDTLKENALSVLSKEISETDCDCVVFGMDRVSDSEVILPFQPEFSEKTVIRDKKKVYMTFFCGESLNSLCRKAVKKTVFHDFDFSEYYGRISYGEDRLQTVEIAKNSSSVLFLTESLYRYRMNPESITHIPFDSSFRQDYTLSRYVYRFLKEENLFSENDFSVYFGQYFLAIIRKIKNIARSNLTLREKSRCIKSYKSDDFYKLMMKAHPCIDSFSFTDKILFLLFKSGLYKTIVWLCNIR